MFPESYPSLKSKAYWHGPAYGVVYRAGRTSSHLGLGYSSTRHSYSLPRADILQCRLIYSRRWCNSSHWWDTDSTPHVQEAYATFFGMACTSYLSTGDVIGGFVHLGVVGRTHSLQHPLQPNALSSTSSIIPHFYQYNGKDHLFNISNNPGCMSRPPSLSKYNCFGVLPEAQSCSNNCPQRYTYCVNIAPPEHQKGVEDRHYTCSRWYPNQSEFHIQALA